MRLPAALRRCNQRERFVDDALETYGALVEVSAGLALRLLLLIALTEELVGDIERNEHGEPEHVARRRRIGRRSHLLVDVGRELGDVPLVQRAANRITLARDFDSDHATQLQRLELIQHLGDARPDEIPLVAQRAQLG